MGVTVLQKGSKNPRCCCPLLGLLWYPLPPWESSCCPFSMGDEQLLLCPGLGRLTTNVLENLTHFPWHTLTVTLLLFLLSYLWRG